MAARLIINADDFGLTSGINRAIAELHRAGVLTSATLMANGPAFEDAVAVAKSLPALGVGCHIVLVDGSPVSPPSRIPTLLGPDHRSFRASLGHFVRDLLLGRIDEAEIAIEAAVQIQKLESAGVAITHVDTHKHTHLFPQVARPLLRLTSLPAIRNPFEPAFARRVSFAPLLRRLQTSALSCLKPAFQKLGQNTPTTNGTIGIAATGTLTAASLERLLAILPATGTYELCCHPGYNDADLDHVTTRLRAHRDTEREALLTQIPRAVSPTQLIHYGNLRTLDV